MISVDQLYEPQSQFYQILSNPARLAILAILREQEACVCHMEAALGLRQAYISQQLAVLRTAGWIQDRREGWNIYYQICEPRLLAILDAVQAVVHPENPPLPPARAANCPCPKCSGEKITLLIKRTEETNDQY